MTQATPGEWEKYQVPGSGDIIPESLHIRHKDSAGLSVLVFIEATPLKFCDEMYLYFDYTYAI